MTPRAILQIALNGLAAAAGPLLATGWLLYAESDGNLAWLVACLYPLALIFSFVLGLFTSPDQPLIPVRVVDTGRTLGRDWVRHQDDVHWITPEDAARLRAQPGGSKVSPDVSGFSIRVPTVAIGLPFEAAVSRATLASTGGWLLFLGTAAALAVGSSMVAPGGAMAVLAAVTFVLLTGHGAVFAVLHRLTAWIARLYARRAEQLVTVNGLQVSVGPQRFQLGHPDLDLQLAHDAFGAVLTLVDPDQHLQIHGRHAELAALRDAIERWAPDDAGTREAIPEALQRARQAQDR